MQWRLLIAVLCVLLVACNGTPPAPVTSLPPPQVSPTIAQITPSLTASPVLLPTSTDEPMVLPPPYTGPLDLVVLEDPLQLCEISSPFALPAQGVLQLAFIPNRRCTDINSDLDLFEVNDRLYAAQRNARGFRLVEVTNPAQPAELGVWQLKPRAGTGHIVAFRQYDRWYLALPLESPSPYSAFPCGLVIIEVTQPQAPVLQGRYDGTTVDSNLPWCNVHSVEIDTDADGNATFLLALTPNTADVRVLDIRNLDDIREVNAYHLHAHPHGGHGSWAHRATIVGDRIYIAYWGGGVVIVDKDGLETGATSDAVALTPPGSIDPSDFVAHDTRPTVDGNFLFVSDMDRLSDGIRLFDIRNVAQPREIWASDFSDTDTAHHTLQVQGDLLFVPWFHEGLRIFRYDLSDPDHPMIEQVAFQAVREPPHDRYGGVSELKVHPCQIEEKAKTCIYASDERLGLMILALDDD